MKTLWNVIAGLAVLHIAFLIGAVAWLGSTHRLSKERLTRVKTVFVSSVEHEKAAAEADKAQAIAATQKAAEEARASGAAGTVESSVETLEAQRQAQRLSVQNIEQARQSIDILQKNLALAQQKLAQEQAALEQQKKAFVAELARQQKEKDDAGFRKAVEVYESLPAKQAKQMFLDLIGGNQAPQVVAYLEAMEPRKAAAVLKEFKTPEDIAKATDLTERLRQRGSELVKQIGGGA